jgi:hypothetical protein
MKKSGFLRNKFVFISLTVAALSAMSAVDCHAASKNRGNIICAWKENGDSITGMLLGVQDNMLILWDSESEAFSSLAIDEIRALRIQKDSRAIKGAKKGLIYVTAPLLILQAITKNQRLDVALVEVGIPVLAGAALGASSGVDEFVHLQGLPPDKKAYVLERLKARSLFPSGLPADSKDIQERLKARLGKKPRAQGDEGAMPKDRFSHLHLSFGTGHFQGQVTDKYSALFRRLGFGDTQPGGSFFFFSFGPTHFPEVDSSSAFSTRFSLEYSLSRRFALGLNYSPFGESAVRGYDKIDLIRGGNSRYTELYLWASSRGNLDYLSAAWLPVPDTFFSKLALKAGLGIGLCDAKIQFVTDDSYTSSEYSRRRGFSKKTLAAVGFVQLDYYFNRLWSLGMKAQYQYIPITLPAFRMEGCYYDLDEQEQLIHSSMTIEFPRQDSSLSGLDLGITLAFHF